MARQKCKCLNGKTKVYVKMARLNVRLNGKEKVYV